MRRLSELFATVVALSAGCGTTPPPEAPPPPTFDLLAWEYPGARPIARVDPLLAATDKVGLEEIAGEPREAARIRPPALYAFDTPDTLEAVYAFYGRKLQIDPEFRPHAIDFEDETLNDNTRFGYARIRAFPRFRLAYTGLIGRQAVQAATLVGPADPGTSVVVILSRGPSEGFTSIELVVTAGPGGPP